MASIAPIILKGGEWYSEIGTAKAPEQRYLPLPVKSIMPDSIEVPMGTTLREIVFDIGGGILGRWPV